MFNKRLWGRISGIVELENYPNLPCPYCNRNELIVDNESIQYRELSGSALKSYTEKFQFIKSKELDGEEHTWIRVLYGLTDIADSIKYKPSQFIAFFKCSTCKESVSCNGIAKLPIKEEKVGVQLKVENFNPPIPMFPLSSSTPSNVNEELIASFNYFHSDSNSSGNRLRRALEQLCKELGYSNGNLHRSIEAMSKEYPQEGNWLKALKLVGNEATHAYGVTESDLLDSYEVLEVVLDIFRRNAIEEKINNTAMRLESRFQKNNS